MSDLDRAIKEGDYKPYKSKKEYDYGRDDRIKEMQAEQDAGYGGGRELELHDLMKERDADLGKKSKGGSVAKKAGGGSAELPRLPMKLKMMKLKGIKNG